MACCKVPVKIAGFSGGCATITGSTTAAGAISALTSIGTNITTAPGFVSTFSIAHLAYLGLKCVNIACPPSLNVADTLGDLAAFLDANLTAIGTYRSSSINDLTATGATATTAVAAIKAGIAALIAGCGDCCSQ